MSGQSGLPANVLGKVVRDLTTMRSLQTDKSMRDSIDFATMLVEKIHGETPLTSVGEGKRTYSVIEELLSEYGAEKRKNLVMAIMLEKSIRLLKTSWNRLSTSPLLSDTEGFEEYIQEMLKSGVVGCSQDYAFADLWQRFVKEVISAIHGDENEPSKTV